MQGNNKDLQYIDIKISEVIFVSRTANMECGLETVGAKYLKNKVVSGQTLRLFLINRFELHNRWLTGDFKKISILGRPLTVPRSRVTETW